MDVKKPSSKTLSYDYLYGFSRGNIYPHPVNYGRSQISQWRTRLLSEMKTSGSVFNVVLTFNDEHLPATIEELRDIMQRFWKRYRRCFQYNQDKNARKTGIDYDAIRFKFFQISEFGDKNGRIHMHVCLFCSHFITVDVVRKVIDDKWMNGFSYVRRLQPRHCFYNTKYINKKFYEGCWKSQSKGIGLDYAAKVADFAWSHDLKISLYGYERNLSKYQRNKVFSAEQILELRQRYVNLLIKKHQETYDTHVIHAYFTPDAITRLFNFLSTYFCLDDWPGLPQPKDFYRPLINCMEHSLPLYEFELHGIFADYVLSIIRAREDYSVLCSGTQDKVQLLKVK